MTIEQTNTLYDWMRLWCPCKKDEAIQLWHEYQEKAVNNKQRLAKIRETASCKSTRQDAYIPQKNMSKLLKADPHMLITSDGITVALRLVMFEMNYLKFRECQCENLVTQ